MADTAVSFSLVHEPWIEVLTVAGETEQVSLLTLFQRAQEIKEIVGDLPTQSAAIFRLALAVLHRAIDGPRDTWEWEQLWEREEIPVEQIESYLVRWEERFDLFHPTTPFFQVADLHTAKGEFSNLTKLVADVPTRHHYFSVRVGRGIESLSPAEAARWLVHLHAYDISGIKSGAIGDDRVKAGKGSPIGTGWAGAFGMLVVEGAHLWQSLLLNLIPRDRPMLATFSDKDRPAWEAPPSTAAELVDPVDPRPYGPLDLYTWQSRRVRLVQDGERVTEVLVANGDKITPQDRYRVEPMAAWYRSKPQEKALKRGLVYMPRRLDPSRALWRGLGQLLPAAAPRGKADEGTDYVTPAVFEWAADVLDRSWKVQARGIGMVYGTQNAIVNDVVDDRLTLSVALLSERDPDLPRAAVEAVDATEQGVRALRNLAANLAQAAGAREDALIDGARDRASEVAYSALDPEFREWLVALVPGVPPDEHRLVWHRTARQLIRRVGSELIEASGPDAWVGREVSGRRVSAPEADGWFRRALAKALPLPSVSPAQQEVMV